MFWKILFVPVINVVFVVMAFPTNYESFQGNPEETGDFWEGDMILDSNQISSILFSNGRNGLINNSYRWPNQSVFYEIDEVFDEYHITQIMKAIHLIEENTCIRFYPRNKNTEDYIHITGEPNGCYSSVGRRGGKQYLNLAARIAKCSNVAVICHELIHALGFFHQQSAYDRDSYIKIIEENVMPGKLFAFKKHDISVSTDFKVGYDYNSVMHYGEYAFSVNGEKTIVSLDKMASIGQRERLSEKDIIKLNMMYNCTNYL